MGDIQNIKGMGGKGKKNREYGYFLFSFVAHFLLFVIHFPLKYVFKK
jgi:hypothetical protein